jgi:hypothetical protein
MITINSRTNSYNMKTIVIVWKQQLVRPNGSINTSYWGLGDLLRGVCGMYTVCNEMGYNLYVDMRHHPLGQLFKQISHPHETLVDSIKDTMSINTFESHDLIKTFLNNKFKDSDVWCGFMWAGLYIFEKPISEQCKKFIKSILIPTDDYNSYIDAHAPSYKYDIIHFRMGDTHIHSSSVSIPPHILRLLEVSSTSNNILVSDSHELKKCALRLYPTKYTILDTHSCHVGFESDIEKIKSTIFEFIVASRAESIKTFTVYSWISGFVNILHMIYDVPLIIMKA